jgi:patatin-related protein
MAWNGGVSLAIWMAGAAVELDTARRAHLGKQKDKKPAKPSGRWPRRTGAADEDRSDEEQPGRYTRRVYYELTKTFERELVIDILAGASAGGINGALLAAAITNRRALRPEFLRERWLELGDVSALLRPVSELKPDSLMQGDYFRDQVERVFRAVNGEECPQGTDGEEWREWLAGTELGVSDEKARELADEVLLDVQTTNVLGTQRQFSDEWNQTLTAREYRAPLRFRQRSDFTTEALAAAARASASFPAAFEPTPLMNKSARLGGFPGVKRWAIDGGLLENAPIRPALELIPTRNAERQAARFVCYVNASPPAYKTDADDPPRPELRSVLGHVVNLPRDCRLVDHLTALEQAVQRTDVAAEVATKLVSIPLPILREMAKALFPAYRKSRTHESLREAVAAASTDVGDVGKTVAEIEKRLKDRSLPWIPRNVEVPTQAAHWCWGLRAAQRVLLLQRDLLRAAADKEAEAADGEDDEGKKAVERLARSRTLLQYRRPINQALARLEAARQRFEASTDIGDAAVALASGDGPKATAERVADLESLGVGFRCESYEAVRRGTMAFFQAVDAGCLDSLFGKDSAEIRRNLFGPKPGKKFGKAHLRAFLERALCIEVVRRAFAPEEALDAAHDIRFAQLTPLAPARIFAEQPFRNKGPDSSSKKLTGLDVAHFSAFYRRSWRANDFMWGRLDAATRICDLLVSASRARHLAEDAEGGGELEMQITPLVKVLVPEGAATWQLDLRELAREALEDAAVKDPPPELAKEVSDAVCAGGQLPDRDALEELQQRLAQAMCADLRAPARAGFFTRVVCARAAQYEILLQELQPLAEATEQDAQLGCFTPPLRYDEDGPLVAARELVNGEQKENKETSLPEMLGRGHRDEETSDLAVRTLSHTVLLLISSLRTAGLPLAGVFAFLRAPFLSLAAITAQGVVYRVAALLAFIGASFYITARAVTATAQPVPLAELRSASTLAFLIAILTVTGLVFLPLWRAWRTRDRWRRARQFLWGVALLLASGLVALVATGGFQALASDGVYSLPRWLALAVVVLPLGAVLIPVLPAVVSHWLSRRLGKPRYWALSAAAIAIALIVYTMPTLHGVLRPGELLQDGNWLELFGDRRRVAVVAAYLSIPVAASYTLSVPFGRRRRQAMGWLRASGVRRPRPQVTTEEVPEIPATPAPGS